MKVKQNVSLAKLTTFRVGGPAKYFVEVNNLEEVREALKFAKDKNLDFFVLGGGANTIASDDGFNGLVIKINIKNFEVIREDENYAYIKIGAGENWDEVVERTIQKNLWGIENLSAIPGTAGAFPVQNVGAYGQEASQVVAEVETWDIANQVIKKFSNQDCNFSYRQSIFKRGHSVIPSETSVSAVADEGSLGRYVNSVKDDTANRSLDKLGMTSYVILCVTLKLQKNGKPTIEYPSLIKYFREKQIDAPTLRQIQQAILELRAQSLPDPNKIGNAGCMFENLYLSQDGYAKLLDQIKHNFGEDELNRLEEIKNKFIQNETIKIPAVFLVDICGLKGKTLGGAQVYEKQPLIIINQTGHATAQDVLGLAQVIKDCVLTKTGVELEMEPMVI